VAYISAVAAGALVFILPAAGGPVGAEPRAQLADIKLKRLDGVTLAVIVKGDVGYIRVINIRHVVVSEICGVGPARPAPVRGYDGISVRYNYIRYIACDRSQIIGVVVSVLVQDRDVGAGGGIVGDDEVGPVGKINLAVGRIGGISAQGISCRRQLEHAFDGGVRLVCGGIAEWQVQCVGVVLRAAGRHRHIVGAVAIILGISRTGVVGISPGEIHGAQKKQLVGPGTAAGAEHVGVAMDPAIDGECRAGVISKTTL